MTRTSIREFRAALADTGDESTPMRAYRRIARTPRYVAERVGGEWAAWPAPSAGTHTFADWPVWNEAAKEQTAAAADVGVRAFGDWGTWQGAALAGRA